MASIREAILARLVVVAAGVTGVAAAGRNVPDVSGHRRPAITMQDGEQQRIQSEGRYKRAEVEFIELTPQFTILATAEPSDIGTLLNIYHERLLYAVATDATISALVDKIEYGACSVDPGTAETKEGRMELTLVFSYTLKLADLAAI